MSSFRAHTRGWTSIFGCSVRCSITPTRPLMDLYRELAGRHAEGRRIQVVLRFFVAPVEVVAGSAVEGITIERTDLRVHDGGTTFAEASDDTETLATSLVIAPAGYVARPRGGALRRRVAKSSGTSADGYHLVSTSRDGPSRVRPPSSVRTARTPPKPPSNSSKISTARLLMRPPLGAAIYSVAAPYCSIVMTACPTTVPC